MNQAATKQAEPNSPGRGAETRERILDAAESLVINRGFAATSLRAITQRAGVNLAAVSYHFGGKNGLFEAMVHRRVEPINKARLHALQALQHEGNASVRAILEAFFSPFVAGQIPAAMPRLIGRVYGEPASFTRPILEREFLEVAQLTVQMLAVAIPSVPVEELRWRLHFLVGSMIQTVSMDPVVPGAGQVSVADRISKLIDYAQAGLQA